MCAHLLRSKCAHISTPPVNPKPFLIHTYKHTHHPSSPAGQGTDDARSDNQLSLRVSNIANGNNWVYAGCVNSHADALSLLDTLHEPSD